MSAHATPTLLSVCIPTYNRIPQLRQSLSVLLPQLNEKCELVVIDNCSDENVAAGIKDLIAGYPQLKTRLLRNPSNIGGGANMLRCVESALGSWVYVLGDDDLLLPSAIRDILEEIAAFPEATYINFTSNLLEHRGVSRPATFTAMGLEGLVRNLDEFSNFLFISAGVFRKDKVLPAVRAAYEYLHTAAVQTCLLLITLGKHGGLVVFSNRLIVRWTRPETGAGWNMAVAGMKFPGTLELIPDAALRKIWYDKVARGDSPPIRTLLRSFILVVSRKGDASILRDDLRMVSYLGAMVPYLRGRAFRWWLAISLATWFWWPFYAAIQVLQVKRWSRKKIWVEQDEGGLAQRVIGDPRL
jgi:glycosyltransferase involved in cell wall biosynthesis